MCTYHCKSKDREDIYNAKDKKKKIFKFQHFFPECTRMCTLWYNTLILKVKSKERKKNL